MIFIYKKWDHFCKKLLDNQLISVPACDMSNVFGTRIVLKHDVETKVKNAFKIAKIENKYGHKGSYYVQAYLLKDKKNIRYLQEMKKMGHEITYHHDVMDHNKGDIEKAIIDFQNNVEGFKAYGFDIVTVCQHGNPLVERVGYTSNRDFFRSEKVQKLYPNIADIMVDFKDKKQIDYRYYSDAGRRFQYIYDPINNDRIPSEDKNLKYRNLEGVLENILQEKQNCIISIHPHRWTRYSFVYIFKNVFFRVIRKVAKLLFKIPIFRKMFGKYYYLAKKI